jgi:excisionase family DNA binding protein
MSLAVELPEELLDALTERVLERVQERPRWRDIEGVAEYLDVPVRRVRDLRERGLPAKRIGRRLFFDLRAVDEWLERQP